MRTTPDPIPADMRDLYEAFYEYAMLESGHDTHVITCGPYGIEIASSAKIDDDLKFFVNNTARAALGLEVWTDRQHWQDGTDTFEAAFQAGKRSVEVAPTYWVGAQNTYTTGSYTYTVSTFTGLWPAT